MSWLRDFDDEKELINLYVCFLTPHTLKGELQNHIFLTTCSDPSAPLTTPCLYMRGSFDWNIFPVSCHIYTYPSWKTPTYSVMPG